MWQCLEGSSVVRGVWHYSHSFHHPGWGHHRALSMDVFIHWIELLSEMSSKCFLSWFNDCILGQFFFQLCIARPLATHLTFLKQRSSSVIGWSTAQSWSGKKCSGRQKTSSQLGSRIVVAFFSWCFLLYLCFRYIDTLF